MELLRLAMAQTNIALGRTHQNQARLDHWAELASQSQADLLLLPELWDVGYAHSDWAKVATPVEASQGSVEVLAQVAQQFRLHIVASVVERRGEALHNTAVVVSPDGSLLARYRKVHLIPLFQEDQYLTPGWEMVVADLPWGRTGLAVCYDLRFPELFRAHALHGAICTLVVAEWPTARIDHWTTLLKARAIENQMVVAGCNRVGSDSSGAFGGRSLVVGPAGEVLTEGGSDEELLLAEVDLTSVQRTRAWLPVLGHRRDQAYRAVRTTQAGVETEDT